MSNEHTSIHEFDLNLICEYFSNIERQGPGSPEITIKALSFIDNLTDQSEILDIGCGSGGQTMTLAQNAPGKILGFDLFQKFIDLFNENAKKLNLQARVKGMQGTMEDLPFQKEEFDLIWSEGAIYNVGFERGLKEWRELLKTGGYVAVSEATWFTDERPKEIEDFWLSEYPGIDTIPNKVAQMQKAGYVPVATFNLPEYCWIENFHIPQRSVQEIYLEKYKGNTFVENFVAYCKREEELYFKYKEFYGYTFFIGKKI